MIDGFQDGLLAAGEKGEVYEIGIPDSQDRRSKGRMAGRERGEVRERETEREGGEGIERKARTITRKMSVLLQYETASDSKGTDADGLSRKCIICVQARRFPVLRR